MMASSLDADERLASASAIVRTGWQMVKNDATGEWEGPKFILIDVCILFGSHSFP